MTVLCLGTAANASPQAWIVCDLARKITPIMTNPYEKGKTHV